MHNKHKLFTILAAFVTAFSFLAIAKPASVSAGAEKISEGYYHYIPAMEHATEEHTGTQTAGTAISKGSKDPLLSNTYGNTYGHSDLIKITNADFFERPLEVTYPDGFTVKVEVDHPEFVKEIEWFLSDGYDLLFIPGRNQDTYEFRIPSTNPYDKEFYLCAAVTDIDGGRLVTEDLHITVDASNRIPVLYVAEYALTAGESIDLADVDYGTGTIEFDANGTDVTFTDVQMDVPESAKYMDKNIAMGMDIFFFNGVYNPEDYKSDLPTNYNFNFVGNTSIVNNLYDEPTYSALGVELNFYFYCADNYANRPTVTLKSDNPLTIYGGARGINTDANLVLDLDLSYTPVHEKAITTAIYSTGLTVTPNHALNITSNGGIIESNGDVILEDGTTIIAESTPTQAHNEWLGVAAVSAGGDLKMSNAKFDFTSEVVANKFIVNSLIRYPVLISNQDMEIKDSDVNIDVKYTGESPRGDFAANLAGLYVNGRDYALTIDNSDVSVVFDAPKVINVAGISSLGAVNIIDSNVNVEVSGRGQVLGVSAQDLLTITDSNVNSNVVAGSYPDSGTDEFAGIIGRPVVISLSSPTYKIHSKISQGAAFVSADKYPIPAGADQPAYDADYAPSFTKLNGAEILLPGDGVLSSYTYGVAGGTILYFAETPYNLSDTSAPALEVAIAVPSKPDDVPDPDDAPIPDDPSVPNTGVFTGVKDNGATASFFALMFCGGFVALAFFFKIRKNR